MAEIREIKRVAISDLKLYKNNAKIHDEAQIRQLGESIKEYGFISPVLIDKDNNVIAGHGRIEAAKSQGMAEVPCLYVEGLTEDQRKGYILADNKLAEGGKWDRKLVRAEIGRLVDVGFNLDSTGFKLPEAPKLREWYGDERLRTNKAYNLEIAHNTESTVDFWEMPVIKDNDIVPDHMIGFNYAKTSDDKDACIHFYVDDYQFERVWNYPEKYVDILNEYKCMLSPDFSLYMDMPMPMKIWNVYRSRQIGAYYQRQGIKVIPTLSWAEPETYEFCFKGIPEGSIVSVSTVGVKNDEHAAEVWRDGMDEAIRQIKPRAILIYGSELNYDFKKIDTYYYKNEVTENWRRLEK